MRLVMKKSFFFGTFFVLVLMISSLCFAYIPDVNINKECECIPTYITIGCQVGESCQLYDYYTKL